MNIKNTFLTICLIFISITISSYKYPEKLPQWDDLSNYKMDKLKFGETTISEFNKISPNSKKEIVGKDIIYTTYPTNKSVFNKVRVGFLDKKLDWVEFSLKRSLSLDKIVETYGKPRDINTTYSNRLDYYDYNFFNVSVNKNHTSAKAIALFEIPLSIADNAFAKKDVKVIDSLNSISHLGFKPGSSLESEFISNYPDIHPHKKNKFDTTSLYILDKDLGRARAYYKEAILRFDHGLLTWVNLVPYNMNLRKVLSVYQGDYTIEQIDAKYEFYKFKDKILVVDRIKEKIIFIGLMSS